MVKYYQNTGTKVTEIETPQGNCWIDISPPFDQDNLKRVSNEHNIPFDYLIDSLDVDERSRFEMEDGVDLIVIKSPIKNKTEKDKDKASQFVTIPIGIVICPNLIVTISAYDNPIINDFIDGKIKRFDPVRKREFVLHLFERTVYYFLQYLKEINYNRNMIEYELQTSLKNEKLFNLLNIKKSLVYFVTSLRSNEMMMMKIHRTNHLLFTPEELDELQDIIVDTSQALEMANIYTNIINSTMDAYSSIISNNLNVVIRRLTSVTIILMIPTLVASFYGMNVELPLQHTNIAFLFTILLSFFLVLIIVWVFMRKKWF